MTWDARRFDGIKARILDYTGSHGNVPIGIEIVARDTGLSLDDVTLFHDVMRTSVEVGPDFISYDDTGRKYFLHRTDHVTFQDHAWPSGARVDVQREDARGGLVFKAKLDKIDGDLRKWNDTMSVLAKIALILAACIVTLQHVPVASGIISQLIQAPGIEHAIDLASLLLPILVLGSGGIVALHVDARASKRVAKGIHSGYGTASMIAGIIGCFAWGTGAVLLVKGLGFLWLENDKDAALKRTGKAGLWEAVRGLNGSCWRLVLYVAAGHLAFAGLAIVQVLNGAPLVLLEGAAVLAVPAILGVVGGGGYKQRVFRQFKEGAIRDVAVNAIAFGIVSTACFGSGVPVIVTALLMFHMGSVVNEAARKRRERVAAQPGTPGDAVEPPPATARPRDDRDHEGPARARGFVYDLFASDGHGASGTPGSSDLFKPGDDDP